MFKSRVGSDLTSTDHAALDTPEEASQRHLTSKCEACAKLHGARTGAFGGLKTANRPEGRRPENEVRYAVIRMIKKVRGRSPQTKSCTLLQFEGAIERKIHGLRPGPNYIAHWIVTEPADIVLGRGKRGRVDPLVDILI